jgi:mycoredoxin
MYGTTWCGDCHRAKSVLDQMQEPYEWIDVEQDVVGRTHLIQVVGKVKVPLLEFPDQTTMVEPSNDALKAKVSALRQAQAQA